MSKQKCLIVLLAFVIVFTCFYKTRENLKDLKFGLPYNFKYGGSWPPDMYSRLYYWSPAFYNGSGLSLAFRPGMEPTDFPRNRWIYKTNMGDTVPYYHVNNRDDYRHDVANYKELPLRFRT